MADRLNSELLKAFRDRLAAQTGWRLPDARLPELSAIVQALGACQQSPWASLHRLAAAPLTDAQIQLMAGHFTIGETSFFRDAGFYATLEHVVLKELIARRQPGGRQLSIWSAGCCTGEEPYSVAILLQQLLPDIERWQIQLVGTDINPLFLQQAQAGHYRAWALRNAPERMRQACFSRNGAEYHLAETIRRRVTFDYCNLVDPNGRLPVSGGVDLVICRNVLMYLDEAGREQALRRFEAVLNEDGWLLVSPIDGAFIQNRAFHLISLEGGAFYRKRRASGAAAGTASLPRRRAASTGRRESPLWITATLPSVIRDRSAAPAPAPRATPAARPAERYRPVGKRRCAWHLSSSLPAPAMRRLAHRYADRQSWRQALFWCRQCLADDSQNVDIRYLAALAHAEMGQPALADRELRRVIYLDSTYVLAYLARASLALKRRQARDARQAMQAAARLLQQPGSEALVRAAGLSMEEVEVLASTLQQQIGLELAGMPPGHAAPLPEGLPAIVFRD